MQIYNRLPLVRVIFSGDRASNTIKVGRIFRRLLPQIVQVSLWDGYRSEVYFGIRRGNAIDLKPILKF